MEILGRGVYSIGEAARLTRLRSQRVREWFLGGTGGKIFRPVFESDYPLIGDVPSISFLDLVEVFITGQLRESGISLQYIRRVYDNLEKDYGPHPLCSREIFVSDTNKKKRIFTRGLDEAETKQVIEALTKQRYFEQIIGPFLKKIDYDEASNLAIRWHIADMVVVDPSICFGKPTVESIGITTQVLASSYFANGQNAKTVADWYEIEERHVIAAVNFESELAA